MFAGILRVGKSTQRERAVVYAFIERWGGKSSRGDATIQPWGPT